MYFLIQIFFEGFKNFINLFIGLPTVPNVDCFFDYI